MRQRHLGFTILVVACFVTTRIAWAAQDFGAPVPGQRVYDRSGGLTSADIQAVQHRADELTSLGAPTVVYIRVQDATASSTQSDAQQLMDQWSIESRPGAKDGVVLFVNLRPPDSQHGQVAVYAGQTQLHRALPESELRRTIAVMQPLLAQGQLAPGVDAGLDELANQLLVGEQAGPPPAEGTGWPARYGIDLAAVLALMVCGPLFYREWRLRSSDSVARVLTQGDAPTELTPGLAGALVHGAVRNQLLSATILDFARRGMLSIKAVGRRRVQLELGDG